MVNLTNVFMLAQTGNLIGDWLYGLSNSIGNFGWTVVVFTIILKLVTSPFDIWQKVVMRKNNNAMKRMKPELEKLQKQYANNQQLLAEKQMQLYKREHFSTLGACLPMIITMVIFFVVFAGFNATVQYQNKVVFLELQQTYNVAEQEANADATLTTDEAKQQYINEKVLEKYEGEIRAKQGFLWIENIFMPDTWSKPIPAWGTFIGTGMGKLNIQIPGLESREYQKVMSPIIAKYNTRWNGYLILPILAFVLNVVTSKMMQKSNPQMPQAGSAEMQKANQLNMKMMQWLMPIMMLVFAVLYSSAFTLYMFVSALVTTLFQLITNLAFKIIDKKAEEKKLSTTYK